MKRFITKVIFTIAIFIAVLPIYEKYDFIFEILQYEKLGSIGMDLMYYKVSKVKNEDIIYFGDSVIRSYSTTDSIKKSIVEIINDSLNIDVIDLSNFGSSPIIFSEYVKYLLRNNIHPKLIIVPINLRILSPLQKNIDLMWRIPLINELRGYPIPFDVYNFNSKYLESNDSLCVETPSHGNLSLDKWDRIKISSLKKSYVERYFQTIDNDNKNFQSYVEMTELLIKNKIDFIYYLTPINGNVSTVLENDFFLKRIVQNKQKIKSVLENEFNKNFIDLSLAVESSLFTSKGKPDEHLNFLGRKLVADKVVHKILQKYYKYNQ